jgi:hypothetical protein
VEYFAVGKELCRRRLDESGNKRDEIYVYGSSWQPSAALREPGTAVVRRIPEADVGRFLEEYRTNLLHPPEVRGAYAYFAWVDEGFTVTEPAAVIRNWVDSRGYEGEESCMPGSGWKRSDLRDDWHRGKIDGRFEPIAEQAAERFRTSVGYFVVRERNDERGPVLCRRWIDQAGVVHDEEYHQWLFWRPAGTSHERHHHSVRRISSVEAEHLQAVHRKRMAENDPDNGKYRYLAWLDGGSLNDPDGLLRTMRTPTGVYGGEQRYSPGAGWRDSYLQEDWRRGRYDGEFVPISPSDAARIIERWSAPQ